MKSHSSIKSLGMSENSVTPPKHTSQGVGGGGGGGGSGTPQLDLSNKAFTLFKQNYMRGSGL
jgi:hypothetical protein